MSIETMGTCRDPGAFYDLIGEACENPGSGLCKLVMPRALAEHGSACLDLSYVRDDPSMPPLRPYVCDQATGGLATQCGTRTGPKAGAGPGASTGFAGSTVALTGLGALAVGAAGATGADLRRKLFGKATPDVTGAADAADAAAPATGGDFVGGGGTATAAADTGFKSANDKHLDGLLAIKEMALCHTNQLECATQQDLLPRPDDSAEEALSEDHRSRAWAEISAHRILVNTGNLTGANRRQAYDDLVTNLDAINPSIATKVSQNVSANLGDVTRLGEAQDVLRMAYCTQFPMFCHGTEDDLTRYRRGGDRILTQGPEGMRLLFEGKYGEAEALHQKLVERHTSSKSKDPASVAARTGQMNEVGTRFRNQLFGP